MTWLTRLRPPIVDRIRLFLSIVWRIDMSESRMSVKTAWGVASGIHPSWYSEVMTLRQRNQELADQMAELIAELREQPDGLPYCVKCNGGLKRGQKYSVITVKHDHCPADHCEVVSAKMPQEVEG